MSENVSKKDWKKKTEKKSLKKPQSKPYIVTHWHATLNSERKLTVYITRKKKSKKLCRMSIS